ncbi:MAG: acyl-CoA thioesterase [Desulfuromonadales bacterium]
MADRRLTRSFTLTVRYAETDAQGVVHHANYLTWFEEGRSEFLRQQGCFYSDLERDGFFVIVARAEVDYRAPAYYEDRITIATTLLKGRGRLLEFSYRATNQDGVLVAEGVTRHLVLDADRHLVSLPEKYTKLLVVPDI